MWKKLQRFTMHLLGDYPQYFKCLLLFRFSLTYLQIIAIPSLLKGKSEKENLFSYLGAFKNVEDLRIRENEVIRNIFDTKEIFQLYSKLSTLFITVEIFEEKDSIKPYRPSITQQDVDADNEIYSQLKDLTISCYTPPDILLEFSYIRKKFPNLSHLYIGHQENNNRKLWIPMSETTLDTILKYLFSLERFSFDPCHDIQLPLVKQLFKVYTRYPKAKSLSINLARWYKGIGIQKTKGKPHMSLSFNQSEHDIMQEDKARRI
jgi:hypothetical protein